MKNGMRIESSQTKENFLLIHVTDQFGFQIRNDTQMNKKRTRSGLVVSTTTIPGDSLVLEWEMYGTYLKLNAFVLRVLSVQEITTAAIGK